MSTLDKHSTDSLHRQGGPSGLRAPDARAGREAARALFLLAAGLSFGLSVVLYFSGERGRRHLRRDLVPSILALGALLVPRRAADHEGAEPMLGIFIYGCFVVGIVAAARLA